MSDVVHHGQTPAEEDPVLHGLLASLPRPRPSHMLEDRVLSGVFRPAPRWLRRARSTWTTLNESGRIWVIVGALAAGSTLPLAALLVGALFAAPHAEGWIGFAATDVLPVLRTSLSTHVTSLLETIRAPIDALALTGPEWIGWSCGVVAACLGCSWGLHRTMTPRAARK